LFQDLTVRARHQRQCRRRIRSTAHLPIEHTFILDAATDTLLTREGLR
jgi:hypothetical protein